MFPWSLYEKVNFGEVQKSLSSLIWSFITQGLKSICDWTDSVLNENCSRRDKESIVKRFY